MYQAADSQIETKPFDSFNEFKGSFYLFEVKYLIIVRDDGQQICTHKITGLFPFCFHHVNGA